MNDDSLDGALAKLRAEYAAQLPGTVAQMEQLWQRLVSSVILPSRLAELARMAHSIAGSGTTFGLPGASRAARDLELFLDPLVERARLPDPAEQATIVAMLAALRRAAVHG